MPRWLRVRVPHLALAIGTILVGLVVHGWGGGLPAAARDVIGDMLWAAMVVWWTGVAAPAAPLRLRAATSLAICFIVELSQMYHSPGLDALRHTTVGQLVLGTGFDPRDIVAYTVGVAIAAFLDHKLVAGASRRAV